MRFKFTGAVIALVMCSQAAHAEFITWHAEGVLHNPTVWDYSPDTSPASGSMAAREQAAAFFADGQHFTMDYVIDPGVIGVNIPWNSGDASTTIYAGALRSLDLHIAESGLSYSMLPHQVADGAINVVLNADHRLQGISFRGNTGGNGLTLVSNKDDAAPVFYLISQTHPLPTPPLTTVDDSAGLQGITNQLTDSAVDPTRNVFVVLGASTACHPVSAYCASGTLTLSSFSASTVVPEPSNWMLMSMGLIGTAVAARCRQRSR